MELIVPIVYKLIYVNTNCSLFLYKSAYDVTLIFVLSVGRFDGSRNIRAFIILIYFVLFI